MLDLADNEKFFKQLATTLHLSGDKKKLVAEHFKQMFTPYYVDYYIKKLDEEGLFKTEKPSEKLKQKLLAKKAQELLMDNLELQLSKLPQNQQARLRRAADNLDKAMPIDACNFGKLMYKATDEIANQDDRMLVINYLLKL